MGAFMRDSDAFTWYMERDPTLRSTVVTIAWLERSPDWDVLLSKIDQATRVVPSFRQRVLEPPGRLASPRWTVDDEFDLAWHVRRMNSPAPHTPDTVMAVARNAAMSAFDPARPLWECTLVEELEHGQAAVVAKVHHSLTDGIGGMQVMLTLLDLEPRPPRRAVDIDRPRGERLGRADLIRASLAHTGVRALGCVRSGIRSAVPSALQVVRHPVRTLDDAAGTVYSICRTVAPVRETLSTVMTDRSLTRHLETLEVGLDDLKRAAAAAGGSVNDGFVAGVTGGLRRYHERHGAQVETLRMTLPISTRTPNDPLGGNRITLIRFPVPVGDSEPASRIREVGRRCRAARDERSIPFTDAIAGTLNLLPRGVVGSMLKHVDFVASDVPGFSFPVYLAGARLQRYVAFGPTIGTALNLTLLSYMGTACVGITLDSAAVRDPDVFAECLREGFEEVLDLAGEHDRVRLPLRDETHTAITPFSTRQPSRIGAVAPHS
jgi:diacylglycerol O-acyltransferase